MAVADVAVKGFGGAFDVHRPGVPLSAAKQVDDDRLQPRARESPLLNPSTIGHTLLLYALFDGRQRLLTYVNAGHNPPLMVRARARAARAGSPSVETRRLSVGGGAEAGGVLLSSERGTQTSYLTTGGPVIGLFDEFVYEQEAIKTESGDDRRYTTASRRQ